MPLPSRFETYLRSKPNPWWFAACVLLIALVAIIDYLTGHELSVSILYLAPIFLAAWILGRDTGLTVSLIAAATGLGIAGFAGHMYSHPFYHFWDAALNFVTFAIFAVIISKLKTALSLADERFVTVLEKMDSAVYVTDSAGSLLYANRKFHEAFGDRRVLPDALRAVEPVASAGDSIPGNAQAALQTEFHDVERDRWYLIHSRATRWVDGATVRLQLATDVTGQKRADALNRRQQEKLQMTARLISMGEMASTLAHEMNQPLAAIANYCMGCVRRLRSGNWDKDELLSALEKSSAQAERAGRIIQRVREFVRKREPNFVACHLNDVITGVATLIEVEAEKNSVRLSTDLATGLPPVRADPVMIEQLLLNLVKNGIEAMQEIPADRRRLSIFSSLGPASTVEVTVSDTGPGVAADFEQNVATPFFTTKPEGMGLGLHICRSIVEIHAGRLWVTPNPAGGSTFHFSLPVAQP